MYINYNYPYYPKHMDALDLFQKDNDWLEYRIKVPEVTPPKFAKTAQLIESRYNLHVHKFTKHELVQGGMGKEVFRIVNETYKDLYDFQQLTDRADRRVCGFVYQDGGYEPDHRCGRWQRRQPSDRLSAYPSHP